MIKGINNPRIKVMVIYMLELDMKIFKGILLVIHGNGVNLMKMETHQPAENHQLNVNSLNDFPNLESHNEKGKHPLIGDDDDLRLHETINHFPEFGPHDYAGLEAELKLSGDRPHFSSVVFNFSAVVNSKFQKYRNYVVVSFIERG